MVVRHAMVCFMLLPAAADGLVVHSSGLRRVCNAMPNLRPSTITMQEQVQREPPRTRGSVKRGSILGATAAAVIGAGAPAHASMQGTEWPLWRALPLAPYGDRKTLAREVVPGKVWVFDQILGVFYVHVPIRMSVRFPPARRQARSVELDTQPNCVNVCTTAHEVEEFPGAGENTENRWSHS
eukprot:6196148-Pleurochrysis_carterae.AAC.1